MGTGDLNSTVNFNIKDYCDFSNLLPRFSFCLKILVKIQFTGKEEKHCINFRNLGRKHY